MTEEDRVSAGGARSSSELGDYLVAYALPPQKSSVSKLDLQLAIPEVFG